MMNTIHAAKANGVAFDARLQALGNLIEEDREATLALFTNTRQIAAKRDILRDGQPAERILVVSQGWACRYRLLPDGRRHIVTPLLPGDICNAEQLIGQRVSHQLATLTAYTLIEADAAAMQRLIARIPAIAQTWLKIVLFDSAILSKRSAGLGRRSARERLAHLLCELHSRLNIVDLSDDDGFPLPLTQEAIADMIGLTPVHVNRTFQALCSDGLIACEDHRLSNLDWPRLRAEAGFNGDYILGGTAKSPNDRRATHNSHYPQMLAV